MGLSKDISKAFQNLMSNGGKVELTADQVENVDNFAEEMTEAFKQFLSAQTFEITEMKAFVELEDIRTEDGWPVDVNADTLSSPNAPVISAITSVTGVDLTMPTKTIAKGVSKWTPAGTGGAELHKLDLSKRKGLKSVGYAYLGKPDESPDLDDEYDTGGDSEGWETPAKVKLKYEKIIKD